MVALTEFSCMFHSVKPICFGRNLGRRPQGEAGAGGFAEAADLSPRRFTPLMAKKAAPKAAPAPAPSAGSGKAKSMTKSDVYSTLAEKTSLSKKEVASVVSALEELVKRELGKKGPGVFQVPGLVKLRVVRKPATKAKQGVNPFTKEPMTIKAKPARNVVKAQPLKTLKESV
jgi:nucleoid DNA-binding protein